MNTWHLEEPDPKPIGPLGWLLVLLRGVPIALVVFGGFAILLLLRWPERALYGAARPWTPYITRFACRSSLFLMGIGFERRGKPMTQAGAIVANHASWLDIFSLNSKASVYFVSKAEVSGWPGIGALARGTGTVFIARDPKEAKAQKALFEERLLEGHKLLFFPEGTSTDGLRVLPFKSTLFAAFFTDDLRDVLHVQPVTVSYQPKEGTDPRSYGWWGDMDFAPHLLSTLAQLRQGRVVVAYHSPLKVSDFPDRKALAQACEKIVRAGLELTPEAQQEI